GMWGMEVPDLNELVQSLYECLFSIDSEGTIYNDPHRVIDLLSPRVIDETTLFTIDLPDLFDVLNHTQTRTGAATLFRSLVKPLDSLEYILEKQNSVKELENNRKTRKALKTYLKKLGEREPYVHRYLFRCAYCQGEPHYLRHVDPYKLYRESTAFFKNMVEGVNDIPRPESAYIRMLLEEIRNIDETRVFKLIKGPVYKTFEGLRTRKEVKIYTPRIKFTLRSIKPTLAIPYAVLALLMAFEPVQFLAMYAFLGYSAFFWGYTDLFDRKYFMSPLRAIYKSDADLGRGVQSLGMLDELLSFYEYSKSMKGATVLPKVTDADKHYVLAKNARNPILAKGNPNYVPNDVNMDGERLGIITGANSGGKTTYCKTIAQMQLLAQIGCYVPAEETELSIADRILYQAPMFNSIMDAEGRFGTELKRTRDIFFKATPRSLVILDELVEATTYEEKMEISYAVLDGFKKIGSTTILVTHNHELASRLHQEGRSNNLQVEFKNKKPTYRLIQGIAKESHAELVAEKVGFSSKDIEEYLKRKGYLK
ncbi:MAG: DNA mismatch repair protein MutS, partial [Candidatus Bathyarchaeota archaeon]|nr:DNA mismatch repair protein MutS [Candidatus Bathyarchaeota archaeon]